MDQPAKPPAGYAPGRISGPDGAKILAEHGSSPFHVEQDARDYAKVGGSPVRNPDGSYNRKHLYRWLGYD